MILILPIFTAAKVVDIGTVYPTKDIERSNPNLRAHPKWLSRNTIPYSKSNVVLVTCTRVYLWQEQL
jgi:IS1 family transposase